MDLKAFTSSFVPLWAADRAGHPDFVRFGAFAACDAAGDLLAHAGDPGLPAFMRSSAKPFQAVAFLRRGLASALGLSDGEIACACASHEGQDRHVEAARRILSACGNEESGLLCGVHPASSKDLEFRVARGDVKLSPIHNNCSGKHAAMLAVCRHEGWPAATYPDPDHPLQRENLATLAAFAGIDASSIVVGVDNCTVPTFALPLSAAARAFARLVEPGDLPKDLADAGARAARAMGARPDMVGGDGRLDTAIMELTRGRVIVKTGANGYHAAAGRRPEGGAAVGFALKLSGAETEQQKAPVTIACLAAAGLLSRPETAALAKTHAAPQLNCRGAIVGQAAFVAGQGAG